MTRDEIRSLLAQIKVVYPRFDSAEREGANFKIPEIIIDAWHRKLGWMSYERALQILDRHMESEEGNKVPSMALWVRNGKAQQRGDDYVSATLDRRSGTIRWQPEPDGIAYELKANWSSQLGCWVDDEDRIWVVPGE